MTFAVKADIIFEKTKQSDCPLSPQDTVPKGRYRLFLLPLRRDICVCGQRGCPHFCLSFLTRGCFTIAKKEMQINEQIRDNELRIIGADGAQLGVMSAREAQSLADEAGLDLVKIAPTATPPVCRIMDYGKYRFEQAKKEKEARKNQRVVDVKEVRLGLNTDVGDFNTKVNQATKFLQHGDKVKVSIRFRGREMGHPEMGLESMRRFAEACAEVSSIEKPAKLEGRNMLMFLAPKSAK